MTFFGRAGRRIRAWLLLIASLSVASSSVATPVIVVVIPGHVIIASNHVNSKKMNVCKLKVSEPVVFLEATGLSMDISFRDGHSITPNLRLWKALEGPNDVSSLQFRLQRALEDWARAVVKQDEQTDSTMRKRAGTLADLASDVVVAVARYSGPEVVLWRVTFTGWPAPKATMTLQPATGNFFATFIGNTAEVTPIAADRTVAIAMDGIHQVLSQMALELASKNSFAGPFDIVDVTSAGVKRLEGDPSLCERERVLATGHKSKRANR